MAKKLVDIVKFIEVISYRLTDEADCVWESDLLHSDVLEFRNRIMESYGIPLDKFRLQLLQETMFLDDEEIFNEELLRRIRKSNSIIAISPVNGRQGKEPRLCTTSGAKKIIITSLRTKRTTKYGKDRVTLVLNINVAFENISIKVQQHEGNNKWKDSKFTEKQRGYQFCHIVISGTDQSKMYQFRVRCLRTSGSSVVSSDLGVAADQMVWEKTEMVIPIATVQINRKRVLKAETATAPTAQKRTRVVGSTESPEAKFLDISSSSSSETNIRPGLNTKMCSFCFGERPSIVLSPCNHMVLCTFCHGKELNSDRARTATLRCPTCRKEITGFDQAQLSATGKCEGTMFDCDRDACVLFKPCLCCRFCTECATNRQGCLVCKRKVVSKTNVGLPD